MEFTKNDMKATKGVAILFMLLLHLFCRKNVHGLYNTIPLIHSVPFVYYIGLFGDACVPIYCFASGYGLFVSFNNQKGSFQKKNFLRILKLLINYWIILVLFVILGFFVGKSEIYPGSIAKFVLNFFVISSSYNGAWWFLQTYIILVILSPFFFKFVSKHNSFFIVTVSAIIYFLTYIQRIKQVFNFVDYPVIGIIVNAIVLLGTSQLPYIVGAIFLKEKIYSKLHNAFSHFSFKNLLCTLGILVLLLFHSFFESMIIAPITGISFICFFNLMSKKEAIRKLFNFFGDHSTNIWLTHMFFYMTIFPNVIFVPKYPILIFAWLLILCLFSSYIINFIYQPIFRIIDKKVNALNHPKRAVS
jgi:hypothetical protein